MGKEVMIARMVAMLVQMLTPAAVKEVMDTMIDKVEEAVSRSPNAMDDVVVLPLCGIIRQALAVPDNDVLGVSCEKPTALAPQG